ncbi:MAG TPA: EAL domain-containing protein [Sedimenticola thiotaurini]|uniref:EAL domain-containing protein n=1 Tax=Sedimenticola thiotaurini TaxID=1543721 RepID=A0A831RM81_9GAMM|nr:EAL domain-containing protein [Sedimenticola thiotaurini]
MATASDSGSSERSVWKRTEAALRFLAELGPANDRETFLQQALRRAAEFYGARWAFAGRFTDESHTAIRTLALYDNGHFPPNITYLLADAPCAGVVGNRIELIPSGVLQRFPNDLLLKTLGVDSYFGVTLDGVDGPGGILVVMHDGPMQVDETTASVLRSFAVRIGAELDRLQVAEELRRRDHILGTVADISSRFLRNDHWQKKLHQVMFLLGDAAAAGRIWLVHNRRGAGGGLTMEQEDGWSWDRDAVEQGSVPPAFHGIDYRPDFCHWEAQLEAGRPVREERASAPPGLRAFLERQEIQALVAVPVKVDDRWWGFIAFGDGPVRHQWSEAEVEAMQVAGDIIGAAIAHERDKSELNFANSVYDNSLEAIMIMDGEDRIIRVNPAFSRVTGYAADEVIGRDATMLCSGRHDREFLAGIQRELETRGFWRGEMWGRRRSGEEYPLQMSITLSQDASGQSRYRIALFNDISDEKRYQEHIQHLALYDPLTDLPNRRLFQERLDQALRESRRQNKPVALLYVDLDNFKPVNDTFGHDTGDRLLLQLTERLRGLIREADTLARLGGDEFTIILHQLEDRPQTFSRVSAIAEQIIEAVNQPFLIDGHDISLSASVGIALYPRDAGNRKQLILHADRAMYHAKESGKNTFRFYSEDMDLRARRRLLLEARLRSALLRDELVVHYQPQSDLSSGRIVGLEALVRWRYDDRQLLFPGEFIPLAEETGEIVAIGYWVIRTACRQLRSWHDQGYQPLTMTINISPRQLIQADFPDRVAQILRETGVPAEALEFDTTEKILVADGGAIEALTRLKKMGIHIALDDFGTGYSSLAQLQNSPLDTLKIDASFISQISGGGGTPPLAAAIISLARGLNLRVIAEGVENASQLEFLRHHHCECAQGLMLGDSIPAEKIPLLLDPGWQPDASRVIL